MPYQCSRCGRIISDGCMSHECVTRPTTYPMTTRLVDGTPMIWKPDEHYHPKRVYKCGKCGSEFDNPAVRGIGREGTVCPFCGFGREREEDNKYLHKLQKQKRMTG